MDWAPASVIRRLFAPELGASDRLIPRWLFLRALGLIYFSAFFSLVFQIRGLIGPDGILPAHQYLEAIARSFEGPARFWFAPTLLWFASGSHMLLALCWVGMAASVVLVLNLWPRAMLGNCLVCFLSFIAAAGEFSSYQSDGMLLEAGFISLFFTAPGFRPGLGAAHPPSRASLFLLQWEWFRIYFESGVVKLASGDPQWRNLTAMDEYYQNGPLPTWVGWYAQHLPHWYHVGTAFATLAIELVLVWMFFLPRRFRIIFFWIATCLQIGIILTANYTFLNYLVLVLGVLLLDDRYLERFIPVRWKKSFLRDIETSVPSSEIESVDEKQPPQTLRRRHFAAIKLAVSAVMLTWIFYVTTALLLLILFRWLPLPTRPIVMLEPFRIANQYGLFAVMTRGRYEIEFQGSNDGQNWTAYPFRYKPQDASKPPGIYAPYQPRFDWNLWFASLGSWREYSIVPNTEIRLLTNDRDVLALFAGNPFPNAPPRQVRAVLWQYWFTTMAEKRATGQWWRRQFLGLYAPVLERGEDGRVTVVQFPEIPPRE